MSTQPSAAKKLVFVAVGILLFVALCEGGSFLLMRSMGLQPDPLKDETHLYDPFRTHRLNPEYRPVGFEGEPLHSRQEFRRASELRNTDKTFRIFLLGGSTVYGTGTTKGSVYPYHPILHDDETIDFYLERMLNEAFRDKYHLPIEVVNAGVIGYQTFQNLVYINSIILNYNPDAIVTLDGQNDFFGLDPNAKQWLRYGYGTPGITRMINQRSMLLPLYLFVRGLAPYSQTFSMVEKIARKFLLPQSPDYAELRIEDKYPGANDEPFEEKYRQYAASTFIRALWQIHKLGELERYKHYIFLQPRIVFEKEGDLSAADNALRKLTVDSLGEKTMAEQERMYRMLPGIFAAAGLEMHDLGSIGAPGTKEKQLYIDYCHFTPEGSKVVAGRIFAAIRDALEAQLQRKAAEGAGKTD